MADKSLCKIDGCRKPAGRREWCFGHYYRWRKYGDPNAGSTANGEPLAFIEKVISCEDDRCVPWPFAKTKDGYAKIFVNGALRTATRIICEKVHGEPVNDQQAAHSCGNSQCVNPRHLRWATVSENHSDKLIHGTDRRGEKCPTARLSKADVLEIRRLRSVKTLQQIADQFGVSKGYVSLVHTRRRWAWLE